MGTTPHIQMLGTFRVSVGGQLAAPMAERLQSLLAYLILHAGSPQLRVRLASTFWPEMSESNGRNNLRQLIHQLRRTLPDSERYLRSDAQTVQWVTDAAVSVDVALFDTAWRSAEKAKDTADVHTRRLHLQSAVDLCQGTLVPDCYDDWIAPFREQLLHRCKTASAELVKTLEDLRDYASAIDRVRHWLAHDAFDEQAHRWLMRLLALSGDRAGALQSYKHYAEALQREFGAKPGAALVREFEQLRAMELLEPPKALQRNGVTALPPLIGRQSEWAQLRQVWEAVAQGASAFAIVVGDAGIGKSRLAEELMAWTQSQGFIVAKTRCYAAEGQLSLAPVSEWLQSPGLSPHLAHLESVWRVELARLLPALGSGTDLSAPTPILQYGDRLRFFESLARAVLCAPSPVLLVIDDLHWCDRETLEWLHFLCRFAVNARLLVLGTARAEVLEPTHPLPTLLRQLRTSAQLREIALEPLDAAETAKLAATIGHREFDAEAATRLYRETEGYPLFVVESMRAESTEAHSLPSTSPDAAHLAPRAHAVISEHLAQLSDDARSVMSAASVVGREFDGALLARLFDNEDVVTRALDELWRKRVIRENGPNSYDFTHDKIREVAYIETSVPQRRLWHRRVAEALIAVSSQSASNGSAQVAAHYAQAGLFEQAVPFYLKATNVTQALYAHDHTIALALRCLALLHQLPSTPQRDAWELELQLVLAPSYRVTKGWAAPELGNVLDRALTLCDRVGTEPQRVTVLYGMQSFYAVAGLLEKSSLITDELVHVLQRAAGAQPPRAAFAMQAGLRVLRGQFEAGSAHMDRLVEPSGQMDAQHFQQLQQSQGLNYEVHLRVWQSHALWCLGQPDTALNRALHAVKMAEQLAQPFSLAIASTYLALLQQLRADAKTFRQQAQQALELVTAANATYYRAWCTILVAYACTLEAADDTGLAPLSDAIEQFKATGARVRLPYYLALLAEAHLRANQAHAGLEIVEQALSHSHSTGEHWWDAELYRLRAELLCIHGANSEQVEIALQRALEIARTQRAKSLELRAASSLARQWASAGRVRQARDLLTPIYSAFTEGLDTPDLLGAATLLHQC